MTAVSLFEGTMVLLLALTVAPCTSAITGNVALRAEVTGSGRHAWIAMDRKPDLENSLYGPCAHSVRQRDPWWRVELSRAYNITMVTIANCCGHRLIRTQFRIGNSLQNHGNDNPLATIVTRPIPPRKTITFKFSPMEGRYVNMFLPGTDKTLPLCEVEVYAVHEDVVGMPNVALQGRATQSSLYLGEWSSFSLPEHAIDGNCNPDLKEGGSCTHTAQENDPWWRVDLHRRHKISSVALTNRGDCCSERLNGAQIRIGDSVVNNGKENPECAIVSFIPEGETMFFDCGVGMEGRFVIVVLPGEKKILTLCEVKVFGTPLDHNRESVEAT